MQIFYCETCGTKVSEVDLDSGRASKHGDTVYCRRCRPPAPAPAAGSARKSGAAPSGGGAEPRKSNPQLPAVGPAQRKPSAALPTSASGLRKSDASLATGGAPPRKSSGVVTAVGGPARKSSPALPAVGAAQKFPSLHARREAPVRSQAGRERTSAAVIATIVGVLLLIIGLILIRGRPGGGRTPAPPAPHEGKPGVSGAADGPRPEAPNAPPPDGGTDVPRP